MNIDTQEEYFNLTNRLITKCLDLQKEYKNLRLNVINIYIF